MIYWVSRLARLFVVINSLLMLSGLILWYHEETRLGTEQRAPAQAPRMELPQHLRDLLMPRA
jgi:branched-subunit amino acid ABC-type transport system permease component